MRRADAALAGLGLLISTLDLESEPAKVGDLHVPESRIEPCAASLVDGNTDLDD
jgi:hypothetical protein